MIEDPLTATVVIAVAAVSCQWVAARLAIPSVLLLLAAGMLLSGVIDPDELFGELLFSFVGLGVAILLFEGGTSLNWSKLQTGRQTVIRLVSVGAVIAWAIGSLAVSLLFDVDTQIALLIGSILIVSGPTVVMPLLRVVRPREPTGSILRWEGILIDPIGAALAIVILDAIIEDRSGGGIAVRVFTTFLAGLAVGLVVTFVMIAMLRRRMISDHLQVPAILAAVIASYGLANELRPESGLIAVTVLGVGFANQRRAPAAHIVEFNENLGASVLGFLFIVLGARVEIEELVDYLPQSLALIAVLVILARPATVMASTVGTSLGWRDRAFLMALAPRGVVAAAVASLFAIELGHNDIDPGPLVPVVFSVVVGTVTLAGVSARLVARRLRVAEPDPNGVALIGGGRLALELAHELGGLGVPTLHVALGEAEAEEASARGQLVYQSRLDVDDFPTAVRSLGIAHAVALSGTDHLDGYAAERIRSIIGSENIHGLAIPALEGEVGTSHAVAPRPILPPEFDAERLADLFASGARLRTLASPRHRYPRSGWLTLCRVDREGNVTFDTNPEAAADGDMVIQLGPGLSPNNT